MSSAFAHEHHVRGTARRNKSDYPRQLLGVPLVASNNNNNNNNGLDLVVGTTTTTVVGAEPIALDSLEPLTTNSTTNVPSEEPTLAVITQAPATQTPTTLPPTTLPPTTLAPTTLAPTTLAPTFDNEMVEESSVTIAPTAAPTTTATIATIFPTSSFGDKEDCSLLEATLFLEYTFEVQASDAADALVQGSQVNDMVMTNLRDEMNLSQEPYAVSKECAYIADIVSYAASINGLPCTGHFSLDGSLPCYQMQSMLGLEYLGYDDHHESALLEVMDLLPLVFEEEDSNGDLTVDYVGAYLVTVPDESGPSAAAMESSQSTNNSTNLKPTGAVFLAFAAVAFVSFLGIVLVRRRRTRTAKQEDSLVTQIRYMSRKPQLNVSVDNVRLADLTFDESFDSGYDMSPVKRQSHIDCERFAEEPEEMVESFEADDQGRLFHSKNFIVKLQGKHGGEPTSYTVSDTVRL